MLLYLKNVPRFLVLFFLGLSSFSLTLTLEAATDTSDVLTSHPLPLFVETFGSVDHPAIVLNAGAGNPGFTWDDCFCEKLAARGYYVVRYDYRDTGLSPAIDFDKKPYSAIDLAQDVEDILEQKGIKKAHLVGFSMGGQVAQVMAAYKPEKVSSLVLIGTSSDFDPGFRAMEGKPAKPGLSPPDAHYVAWATRPQKETGVEACVGNYVRTWQILDGDTKDFDEAFFRQQGEKVFSPTLLKNPYKNHACAMKSSFEWHRKALSLISQPTLIIQGGLDPVFPPDHGRDMAHKISKSQLHTIPDMGHALSPQHFDKLIHLIDKFIQNQK